MTGSRIKIRRAECVCVRTWVCAYVHACVWVCDDSPDEGGVVEGEGEGVGTTLLLQ